MAVQRSQKWCRNGRPSVGWLWKYVMNYGRWDEELKEKQKLRLHRILQHVHLKVIALTFISEAIKNINSCVTRSGPNLTITHSQKTTLHGKKCFKTFNHSRLSQASKWRLQFCRWCRRFVFQNPIFRQSWHAWKWRWSQRPGDKSQNMIIASIHTKRSSCKRNWHTIPHHICS